MQQTQINMMRSSDSNWAEQRRAESGQSKQFEDTPRPNGHGAIKLAEPQPQRSPQPTMPMPNMPGNIRKLQQQQQPRQHSNCAALRCAVASTSTSSVCIKKQTVNLIVWGNWTFLRNCDMYTLKSSGFASRATTATAAATTSGRGRSSSSSDSGAAAAAAHKCTPMTEFGWKTFDNHHHHHSQSSNGNIISESESSAT